VTFIEFLKNPLYQFWQKPFTHCAAEIERVLESVTKSCVSTPNPNANPNVNPVSPVL
jgi:CCR4-NOT transcription complex subunit 1